MYGIPFLSEKKEKKERKNEQTKTNKVAQIIKEVQQKGWKAGEKIKKSRTLFQEIQHQIMREQGKKGERNYQ